METKTQHTPGPWSIGRANPESGQTFVNIMSFGSRVGTVIHGGAARGKANARLIAAAPDLLAACEMAIALADRARVSGGPVKDNGEFLAAARAAVALTKEEA